MDIEKNFGAQNTKDEQDFEKIEEVEVDKIEITVIEKNREGLNEIKLEDNEVPEKFDLGNNGSIKLKKGDSMVDSQEEDGSHSSKSYKSQEFECDNVPKAFGDDYEF